MHIVTLEDSPDLRPPVVVTVGTFDGLHVGHRSVLDAVRSRAETGGGTGVVVTFNPHPRTMIDPGEVPGILTSLEEKRWRIGHLGIDVLAVVAFTPALRQMSPTEFVEAYLVRRLHAKTVVIGYDHGFGKDRSGDLDTMRAMGRTCGFDVLSIPPVLVEGEPISSTRIRKALAAGDMQGVGHLLGSGYPVVGRVVHGDGRGREMAFPTANVALEEPGKLMPPDGVYAAWAYLPERHGAVLNLGYRPTFNGKSRSLEVHILDFDGDLYGKTLSLEVLRRIRGERRFENRTALAAQIRRDLKTARTVLSEMDAILGVDRRLGHRAHRGHRDIL